MKDEDELSKFNKRAKDGNIIPNVTFKSQDIEVTGNLEITLPTELEKPKNPVKIKKEKDSLW